MRELSGAFASIVTPFTDDGQAVSEIRLARLVRRLTTQGVAGLAICTETGERTTLASSERKSALEIVVRESQGSVPVVVDASADSTASALDIAQHAGRHGARGALIAPPAIELLVEREFEAHVRSIAQYAGLAIGVVDPQGMLSAEARQRLAMSPAIVFCVSVPDEFAVERGVIRTDEFACGEFWASPLVGFDDEVDSIKLAWAMASSGRARAAKAALESLGVDVGGLRAPMSADPKAYA